MTNDNGAVRYAVSLDDSKMKNDAQSVVRQFQQIGAEAQKQGDTIDQAFTGAAANIGKAFAAIGVATTFTEITKQVLSVRGEFEKLDVAFEVMLGDAGKAKSLMRELVQTAATTPFDLQGVANGAKQLLAYGTEAKNVNDTLVRLGNIASGLSIPLNDLVMLYGTTMTQGRLFTQDLRQFMGRGIPLADELAKQFGVTKDEVGNLVTAGKVGFPQVQKAIESLTNEGGKFYGLMDKQSKTIAGQIANIGDAIDMMFNKIGEANSGFISGALDKVGYMIEHYEQFGKVLLTVAAAYGEYKASLMLIAGYNSMISTQEAAIETQRQASLSTLLEETAAQEAQNASEAQNALTKTASATAIDAKVVAMQTELAAQIQIAQQNYVSAQNEAARMALALEAAQAHTAACYEELNAVTALGNGEAIEAAENKLNTAVVEENAAAKALQAQRANVAAAAEAKEVAAQKLSTFNTKADTIAKTANTAATGLFTGATQMATNALNGLKAAFASNPIGLMLVAITSVIGALSLFTSKSNEATDANSRFNEAINGDMNRLNTLKATLDNTQKGLKTYNDAVSGLVSLGKEYNITIQTENGTIKDMKHAYDQLTQAIRKNASEKLLAESQAKANEDAMNAEKEAMDDLMDAAKSATYKQAYDTVTAGVQYAEVACANLQKITSATWNMISQDVMMYSEEIAAEFAKGQEQGERAVADEVNTIENMLRSLGVTDKEIEVFHDSLEDYVRTSANGFVDAYTELERTQAQVQGLTGSTNLLRTTTQDATDIASMGYEELKNKQSEVEQQINMINSTTTAPKVDDSELQGLKSLLIEINNLLPSKVTAGTDAELSKRLQELKTARDSVEYGSEEWKKYNDQIKEVDKTLRSHKKNYAETVNSSTASKNKPKSQKQVQNEKEQLRKQQERLAQDIEEMDQQRFRDQIDMYFQTEEAKIAVLEEGEAKTRRTLELNKEKEEEQIRRDYEDLRKTKIENARKLFEEDPKNKGKSFKFNENDPRFAYTEEEKANRLARENAVDKQYNDELKKLNEKREDADNEYLKKYGTFSEKRQAIANEYNKKIAKAETDGEKKALQNEMKTALADLDIEKLKSELDWSLVFGNLSKVTAVELRKVKGQLRDFKKSDAYKKQTPEQIKVIEDALNQIDDALAEKGGLFGGLVESIKNYKEAVDEVTKAQEAYDNAITEADREQKRQALQQAKENKNAAQSTRDKQIDATTEKFKAISSAIGQLGSAADMSLSNLGSAVSSITSAFGEAAGKIGGIVGAIFSLLDMIQQQGFDGFVDNLFNSVFGAVGGIFQTVFGKTSLWGSTNIEDTITNLTQSNSDLRSAIDRLTETMKDQAGSEATKTYQSAKADIEASMKNTQKLIAEVGGAYSNGFLGIGGHHSANAHINDNMTSADWKRISQITGVTVRGAGDLSKLTSEQMAKIANQATDLWTKIKLGAQEGYKDIGEYLDNYIEYYQQLIDLQNEYNETVTQLSFDEAKSGLEDLLSSTETSAEDVINNVSKYMQKAIVSQILTTNQKAAIQKWYDDFAKAMSDDTLSQAEKDDLTNRYKEIYDNAKKQIDAAYAAAGIDPDEIAKQEASAGSWQSLGEDTGQELNGRFTALQTSAVQIYEQMKIDAAHIVTMATLAGETFSVVSEMNALVYTCSEYLDRIAANTDVLPSMDNKLEKIRIHVERL